jgi:hypothetical protein
MYEYSGRNGLLLIHPELFRPHTALSPLAYQQLLPEHETLALLGLFPAGEHSASSLS